MQLSSTESSSITRPNKNTRSSSGRSARDAGRPFKRGKFERVDSNGKNDVRYALCGEFDFAMGDRLSAALKSDLGYRTVTVDFAQVTYIDATIIGALAQFAGRRRSIDAQKVCIVNASDHVRKLFSICGLEKFFQL